MNKIDKAIADLESRERVESYMYDEVANKYGCSRSAVSRRWRGVSRPRADRVAESRAIHPQQERGLIEYLTELYLKGLPPTQEIMRNFASEIAGRELLQSWVDNFLNRNQDEIFT